MAENAHGFDFGGLHHLALVCSDMERTVDFYTNKLGMKLNKGFDLDGGYGQHFFFDMGGGNELAFFWFRDAQKAQPGIASAAHLVGGGGTISSAHGSMNHVAFAVPADKIDGYRDKLVANGVECTEVVNHDDVVTGEDARTAGEITDQTRLRSFSFCAGNRRCHPSGDAAAEAAACVLLGGRRLAGAHAPGNRHVPASSPVHDDGVH